MKISTLNIFILAGFIMLVSSIGIPLRAYQQKCMIVYTVGETQSVKISAKFPIIPDKLPDQQYQILIKNTQTNENVYEKSTGGIYKRQLSLTPNIIYEICFRVDSHRDFGTLIVQYTAENLFNIEHADIKVPTNLLKEGDFKTAYQNTERLFIVTQKFKDLQNTRKEGQSETFVQTSQINKRLVYISIGEIAIILVAGIYQFLSLRSYLTGKQYI